MNKKCHLWKSFVMTLNMNSDFAAVENEEAAMDVYETGEEEFGYIGKSQLEYLWKLPLLWLSP